MMKLQFDWYITLSGTKAYWCGGFAFLSVGILFGFVVPSLVSENLPGDSDLMILILVFRVLGGVCILIGGSIFSMMVYSIYLKLRHPERLTAYYFWVDLIGGLLGALSFGLPAALIFPMGYALSVFEILPFSFQEEFGGGTSLLIGVGVTLLGLVVLAVTFLVARHQIRTRPGASLE